MHILLTNDDGIFAPGLEALKDAMLAAFDRVTIVAPQGQRSAASHSMTIGKIYIAGNMVQVRRHYVKYPCQVRQ